MNGSISYEQVFRMPQSVRLATLKMLKADQDALATK